MKEVPTHDMYLVTSPINSSTTKNLSNILEMMESPILPLHHVRTSSIRATSTNEVFSNKSLKKVVSGSMMTAVPQVSSAFKVKFKFPARVKSLCNRRPLSTHFSRRYYNLCMDHRNSVEKDSSYHHNWNLSREFCHK